VLQNIGMTTEEHDLLGALAWMCEQYIGSDHNHMTWLDHMCMSAGERAVEQLVKYGLVEPSGRGGAWTQAGIDLLNTT